MLGLSGLFVPDRLAAAAAASDCRALPLTYAVSLLRGIWHGEGWSRHIGDVVVLAVMFLFSRPCRPRCFAGSDDHAARSVISIVRARRIRRRAAPDSGRAFAVPCGRAPAARYDDSIARLQASHDVRAARVPHSIPHRCLAPTLGWDPELDARKPLFNRCSSRRDLALELNGRAVVEPPTNEGSATAANRSRRYCSNARSNSSRAI